jgi:dihydrofolate reductase
MGGENVYSQTIANADRLEITEIDARFDADAFFPAIDEAIWEVEKEEKHLADEKHKYNYTFITYKRR